MSEQSGERRPPVATSVDLLTTTAFDFPHIKVERTLGTCYGLVVRSIGVAKGIASIFSTLAGGEVKPYTELLEDSRAHAVDRMMDSARAMGANAIVGIRFDSSEIGNGLTEVVAYGTAAVVER